MNKNYMPEDELDDLFRKSASAYEPEFDEGAWQAMEQKLNSSRHRQTFRRRIGLATLLLLIGLGSWFGFNQLTTTPVAERHANQSEMITKPGASENITKTDTEVGGAKQTGQTIEDKKAAELKTIGNSQALQPAEEKSTAQSTRSRKGRNRNMRLAGVTGNRDTQNREKNKNRLRLNPNNNSAEKAAFDFAAATPPRIVQDNNSVPAGIQVSENKAGINIDTLASAIKSLDLVQAQKPDKILNNLNAVPIDSAAQVANIKTDSPEKANKKQALALSRFALTVMAAPDLSFVRFSNPGGISTNGGIAISYFLTDRWSVTTGLVKARKVYTAQPEDYNATPGFWKDAYQMQEIEAVCQVLDIPVNIGYNVLQKNKSVVTVRTGLSSYLMLRERYDYEYLYYGNENYKSWEIKNRNRHFFSIYNLSVAYSRQFTKSVWLGAEPFVKMPLSGVGAGKVNLASAGMFLSLSYRHSR